MADNKSVVGGDHPNLTFRRYKDNDSDHGRWIEDVVSSGLSYICPTYVHKTPPCQGSCPSGHDIRGWLTIARGMDKPADGSPWQESHPSRSDPLPICPPGLFPQSSHRCLGPRGVLHLPGRTPGARTRRSSCSAGNVQLCTTCKY